VAAPLEDRLSATGGWIAKAGRVYNGMIVAVNVRRIRQFCAISVVRPGERIYVLGGRAASPFLTL
jgi:hypothetical protein